MYEQWKKAVVHLECATDSEHFDARMKKMDDLREKLGRGEISHEEFGQGITRGSRDLRFHGTALFISHNNRRYLLTARHVLFNEHSAKGELEKAIKEAEDWPQHLRQDILSSAKENVQNKIFNMIFRVPSLDEVVGGGDSDQRTFLMNLGAGSLQTAPYTFSSPDLDLAIVSLRQRNESFAEELIGLGYSPIPSELIEDGPSSEGAGVFTVGFPSATALLGQVSQHPALFNWSSSHYSLPVFSWGNVSMLHPELCFYWCDISIYPGNSGGPVIENGKLVGVVSAQARLPIDGVPEGRARIPFAKIIKTSIVRELLAIQEGKDQWLKA